jgi:hypothetical protein
MEPKTSRVFVICLASPKRIRPNTKRDFFEDINNFDTFGHDVTNFRIILPVIFDPLRNDGRIVPLARSASARRLADLAYSLRMRRERDFSDKFFMYRDAPPSRLETSVPRRSAVATPPVFSSLLTLFIPIDRITLYTSRFPPAYRFPNIVNEPIEYRITTAERRGTLVKPPVEKVRFGKSSRSAILGDVVLQVVKLSFGAN